MTSIRQTVKDKGFHNWLKGALAILFAKQGLDDFITFEITQFQQDILTSIFKNKKISAEKNCNLCTTENVLHCPTSNFCPRGRKCTFHDGLLSHKRPSRPCPNNICQDIRDGVRREHRYNVPSWRNTDARMWCSDPFEIAKCYMPPDGYSAVSSLSSTDFNGSMSIIMNNKRFQNSIGASLDLTPNICTEAREVGRLIRHAPDMVISDAELSKYIDVLVNLLSDAKCLASDPKAKGAVDKLNQLKAQTLVITTDDIISVLDEEFKAIVERQKDKALNAIDAGKDEVQKRMLDNIKNALHNIHTVTIDNLDKIVEGKLKEIKQAADKEKERLKKISNRGKKELRDAFRKKKGESYNDKESSTSGQRDSEKYLREDLITFYRKFHSTIPVSPIVEEHDVPLVDFYVQPPLISVDLKKKFGSVQETTSKDKILSLRELFHSSDEQLYKDIYITAKAGVGKTSFVKRIALIWCQAHYPIEGQNETFHSDDLEVMKRFGFLFMITLRDTLSSLCKVDEMIYSQIMNCLPRFRRYNEQFLEDVLQMNTCLIIIDGLDEWSHPESCNLGFRGFHDLPHRPARDSCTILTTTRSWKLDVLKLSTNKIDRHAEIIQLDESASNELISNAVFLLNKQCSVSEKQKTVEEFHSTASSLILNSLRFTPYILLQMVCLWFDDESLGNSKCEIYSNITELTLSRGLMKTSKSYWSSGQHSEHANSAPLCLKSNELCNAHYDLLLQLGQVAFETLFCSKKESTIVFDASDVLAIVPEHSLSFCLNMGLLTQNRDCRKVASRRRTFSFQHKSVQEYFAALYIQSNLENEDVWGRISNVCHTLAGVLEMSNTFIFLSGFTTEACGRILQVLGNIVSNDDTVVYFRENLLIKEFGLSQFWRLREAIREFQSMQTDMVLEILNSRQNVFPMYVEDIIVDNTTDTNSYYLLKILITNNKANVKSLYIRDFSSTEEFTKLLEATGLQEVHSLQKLVIIAVPRQHDLHNLISRSSNSLKCLRLSFVGFRNNLYYPEDTTMTADIIRTISYVETLTALMLSNVRVTHVGVNELFKTFSKRVTMTEIGLYNIRCIDHGSRCCGEILDLSKHQFVKTLNLDKIPVAELKVDPSSLNECLIGEDTTSVFPLWLECLSNANNLRSLWFRRMAPLFFDDLSDKLSQLVHLNKFGIEITDLGETKLTLSPRTKIDSVYFYKVSMTCTGLWRFIESLQELSHAVSVTLEWCNITPKEDYQQLKDKILSSEEYKVLLNGFNFRHLDHFEFETNK